MPYADLGDVSLCYEVTGNARGQPLVLIHGLGAQMIAWYPGFCALLEEAGFRVIRFDNRDVGLSTKIDSTTSDPPYTIHDMARDVVGLLDHLGDTSAHLVGQSMGGMIAQQVAISFPDRVRSLTSIYSAPSSGFTTNDPEVRETRNRRAPSDRTGAIAHWIECERLSGLDGLDAQWIETFAADVYDRSYCPDGAERQMKAVRAAPDRRANLGSLRLPAAVIHGLDDRLISFHGGVATALAIPGAELHLYADMAHQLTPRLWPEYVGVVTRTASRQAGEPSPGAGRG